MIRKPQGDERESKARAAVGRAIEIGGEVRDVSRRGGQALSIGCIYYLLAIMAFGLVMSSTPWWFKAIGLALFFGAWRLFRAYNIRRRLDSNDTDEGLRDVRTNVPFPPFDAS